MTREEAIKELRGFIGQLTEGCQEAIKVLIPELSESDDERIRKCIGMALTDVEEQRFMDYGTSLKDCLSWLEKQKEHQFFSDAPKEKSVGGDFYSSHKDMDLDEIAQKYVDGVKQYNPEPTWDLMQTAVCYGANWQKEQFEKNRLANCDALSKEDCDRETDFAMEIIEKEHRQPTFNDAINYGMRLQREWYDSLPKVTQD